MRSGPGGYSAETRRTCVMSSTYRSATHNGRKKIVQPTTKVFHPKTWVVLSCSHGWGIQCGCQVVGKLGYDPAKQCGYLKTLIAALPCLSDEKNRKIETCKHRSTTQSDLAGQSCVRPLIDTFQTPQPEDHNVHTCLVNPPLGISLDQLDHCFQERHE